MKRAGKFINFIVPVVLTLVVMIFAGYFGDYYFDLNDDVFMKDILSGVYTGTPAGHNIQMLYPISAFIALFYRLYRALDWYGIFLCACQYLCVFIIIKRSVSISEETLYKVYAGGFGLLFMLGALGSHFLFVQYTFTCGFLSCAALFIIMTHRGKEKGDFVLAVALIILAFLIRSEMLLLTLPFVGVGILIKWSLIRLDLNDYCEGGVMNSRYGERKAHFKTYFMLCIVMLLGIILSQILHNIAYSSPEWKEFNALFDARTELYDFQYVPDYEENRLFYEDLGLKDSQQELLVNYNFGIDESIDTRVLDEVAKYASKQKSDTTPFLTKLIQNIPLYIYRMKHVALQKSYEYPMTDAPFNVIAIILYIGTACIYFSDRKKEKSLLTFFLLLLLFACRSTLWMYIIVRGRDPIRITHPMYLMEIAILSGMILIRAADKKRGIFIPIVIASLIAAMFIPNQVSVIKDEMAERDRMRLHYDALYQYFDDNRDSFYFVDVYTSVSALDGDERTFSEKMFVNVDNRPSNHDIMGGWASKSPLYYEKLRANGFTSMEEALLEDGVYVVAKESSGADWIEDYYGDKGIAVNVEQTDEVSGVFLIYKVKKYDR